MEIFKVWAEEVLWTDGYFGPAWGESHVKYFKNKEDAEKYGIHLDSEFKAGNLKGEFGGHIPKFTNGSPIKLKEIEVE